MQTIFIWKYVLSCSVNSQRKLRKIYLGKISLSIKNCSSFSLINIFEILLYTYSSWVILFLVYVFRINLVDITITNVVYYNIYCYSNRQKRKLIAIVILSIIITGHSEFLKSFLQMVFIQMLHYSFKIFQYSVNYQNNSNNNLFVTVYLADIIICVLIIISLQTSNNISYLAERLDYILLYPITKIC